MSYPLDRLEDLKKEYIVERIPQSLSRIDDFSYSRARETNITVERYQRVALFDYILDKNIQSYREYIHKCALLQYDLLKRLKDGDGSIQPKDIKSRSAPMMNAMITGDISLMKSVIEIANWTIETKEQKKAVSSWGLNYYKTMRYICGNYGSQAEALEALDLLRKKIKNKGVYKAYLNSTEAIIKKDQAAFDEAMKGALKSHRSFCRKGQWLCDTPDELLSHAGVSEAVIGVLHGMEFNLESEQIPKDLVLGLANLAKN